MSQTLFTKQIIHTLYLVLCLSFSYVPFYAQAQDNDEVKLSDLAKNGKLLISKKTTYLFDNSHTLLIKDLLSEHHPMQKVQTDIINFGFVKDTYWFSTLIENDLDNTHSFLFEIGYPLLDNIELYIINPDNEQILFDYHTGDSLPFQNRPIDQASFVFPIELQQSENIRILIKIKTESAMQVPLTIWEPMTFNSTTQSKSLFFGSVMGIIAIMALYNLFLFMSVRDTSYLFFSICLVGYIIVEAALTGIGYQVFWPNLPNWNKMAVVVSANMALAALLMFSRIFLSLNSSIPSAYKWFRILAIVGFLNISLALVLPYHIMILVTIAYALVSPFLGYCAGIYLWKTGFKPARYYTVAFTAFICAVVIMIFAKLRIFPTSFFSENAIHIGAISVVSLLSFALADRINRERNDKEFAQFNAIRNLEKYREVYERALEGLFQINSEGRLLDCNPAFASLLGAKSVNDLKKSEINLLEMIPVETDSRYEFFQKLNHKGYVFGYDAKCSNIDGFNFWATIHARVAYKEQDNDIIEGSIVDITDKKLSEQKLEFLAKHDSLTGLINRSEFENRLHDALEKLHTAHAGHCLLFLDLDQFKIVNDTSGHRAGDELLKCLSQVLKDNARTRDSIARLGGDEFAILLERCPLDKAEEVANTLRRKIADYRFNWEDKTFSVGVSIGIVPIEKGHPSIEEIFSLADTACYGAKDAGRNCIMVHSPKSNEVIKRQSEMRQVAYLKEAIKSDQLVLYKQYIATSENQATGGRYEILVRMIKNNKVILPGAFLPAAERYNAIVEVDKWVIENYFKWLANNPKEQQKLIQVNINLSGQTLGDAEFPDFLDEIFSRYAVPTDKICLEITESTAVRSLSKTNLFISRLKLRGIKFALDDFGSGFSSYSYLKNLKVDTLKIDGSFIRNMTTDPIDRSMVESIANVAQVIGIKTVAEFVENAETLALLNQIGVNFTQGYHIHKPCPIDEEFDRRNVV
ncbi:MAG: diguanylate cyclase (GGDEF)-like protein/PAS domain S-box-containing protein [Oleiphilaceae bacterium]|jgi:diguanylate cyclase (GGDEF)-like protein/PAS domain S-box-containing protein